MTDQELLADPATRLPAVWQQRTQIIFTYVMVGIAAISLLLASRITRSTR